MTDKLKLAADHPATPPQTQPDMANPRKTKGTTESAKIIGLLTVGWVGLMVLMGGIGVLYMHLGDHDKGPSLEELTRNVAAQSAATTAATSAVKAD